MRDLPLWIAREIYAEEYVRRPRLERIADIRMDNLTLVSRAGLIELNRRGWNDLPAELRPSAIATARLTVAARRKER